MNDPNIQILSKFIDYCSLKNNTISRNIANIGTENYKRQDVNFNEMLVDNMNSQLETDNPRHIKITSLDGIEDVSKVVNDNDSIGTGVENNVNLEKEMADLAKNTLDFRFSTKRLSEYFKLIQNAINGGRS